MAAETKAVQKIKMQNQILDQWLVSERPARYEHRGSESIVTQCQCIDQRKSPPREDSSWGDSKMMCCLVSASFSASLSVPATQYQSKAPSWLLCTVSSSLQNNQTRGRNNVAATSIKRSSVGAQQLWLWQRYILHTHKWCRRSGSTWAGSQVIPFLWLIDTNCSSPFMLSGLWSLLSYMANEQLVVRLPHSNWLWEASKFYFSFLSLYFSLSPSQPNSHLKVFVVVVVVFKSNLWCFILHSCGLTQLILKN